MVIRCFQEHSSIGLIDRFVVVFSRRFIAVPIYQIGARKPEWSWFVEFDSWINRCIWTIAFLQLMEVLFLQDLQVHDYLKTEFWRDIEIIRGFGKGQGIYEDALATTEWVQPMADGHEFRNGGGYRLKYDKEGRMRPQGNQNA